MHTIFAKGDKLYGCGSNRYGQLGLGHNEDQMEPQLIMQGVEIRQIACGAYQTVIL